MADNHKHFYRHGIFCFEGNWWNDLKDGASVEPALRMLRDSHDARVPYIHKDVDTVEQLKHYLKQWKCKKYEDYPILYLAYHGEEGAIFVGKKKVTLDDLEEWLEGCKHKIVILFGSCETIKVNGHRVQRFLRKTGAIAALGYRKQVHWFESSAFEMLVMGELQYNALARNGMESAKRRISTNLQRSQFYKRLGFRMVVRNQ